jgi:hypothetical protein
MACIRACAFSSQDFHLLQDYVILHSDHFYNDLHSDVSGTKPIGMEVEVAYFRVLSWHLHGWTKETHKNLRIINVPTEIQTRHPISTSQKQFA